MSEAVLVAFITGGLTLLGTIITVRESSRKQEISMLTSLAVMKTELETLRKEVEKHNKFAERVPALEQFAESAERKLRQLESFHME